MEGSCFSMGERYDSIYVRAIQMEVYCYIKTKIWLLTIHSKMGGELLNILMCIAIMFSWHKENFMEFWITTIIEVYDIDKTSWSSLHACSRFLHEVDSYDEHVSWKKWGPFILSPTWAFDDQYIFLLIKEGIGARDPVFFKAKALRVRMKTFFGEKAIFLSLTKLIWYMMTSTWIVFCYESGSNQFLHMRQGHLRGL